MQLDRSVAVCCARQPGTGFGRPASASEPAASAPAAGAVTVEAKPVGAAGTVLVDGASGMTVYIFTKDTKDSGKSVCTGDCLVTWPALTVEAGATPTGGTGVTGTLGTITREDDGTLQVTYNGLPLYFFKNDAKRRRRQRHLRELGGRQAVAESERSPNALPVSPGRAFRIPAGRGRPTTAGDATLTSSFHGRSCEAGVPVP